MGTRANVIAYYEGLDVSRGRDYLSRAAHIWTPKGRPCADPRLWRYCLCHEPIWCARSIVMAAEKHVECDEDGWPKMTEERRREWYKLMSRLVKDESLVRIILSVAQEQKHEAAPWVFKVDGEVYEDYEHIAELARNRGWGGDGNIIRVDTGAM